MWNAFEHSDTAYIPDHQLALRRHTCPCN
jgi:hypothetical protein